MARKKVKLQWIANNTARKATYKKRVKGLMKKVRELSILCGVQACAITYSPYHQHPEVWPSSADEVERIFYDFRRVPDNEQTKKNLNQESFTLQRIAKARDELSKQMLKNRKNEIEHLRAQCLGGMPLVGFGSKDLVDLSWAVDNQLEAIKDRINLLSPPQAASGANGEVGGVPGSGAAGFSDLAAFGGVGDFPVNGAFPGIAAVTGMGGSDVANISGINPSAAQRTSFELAIEALESQILMEQNNQQQNQSMGNQELLPVDYDLPNFSRNPYSN